MCVLWLSSRSNTFFSALTLVCLAKCFRNKRKSFSYINPDPLPPPTLPVGPRCMKNSLYFLQGKMKKGGMEFPNACTAHATETKAPLSADVMDPTCFTPWCATTLSGVWTVVTPVSSIFHMSLPSKLYLSLTSPSFLKKCLLICTVKACSSGQASCLCTSHGQVRMPFYEAWEPIRTCHVVLIPWLGVFDVVLYRKLICKLPDLKESKTS